MKDIFNYSMVFGQRFEILITIFENGKSEWFDRQSYLKNGTNSQDKRIMRIFGDQEAANWIETQESEFKVTVQLPDDIFQLIQVAAALRDDGKRTCENESTLDNHLEVIFWDQVNPLLVIPLKR